MANGFFRRPEKTPPTEPAPRRRMLLERLEDRLLFDAGPVAPVNVDADVELAQAQEALTLEPSVLEPAEVRVIAALDHIEASLEDLLGQPLDDQQSLTLDPNETPRDESLWHSDELAQQLMTTVDEQRSELSAATADSIRHELVFVDTSVAGYQALLDDLFAQATPGSVFEIELLDATLDGVSQVTAALAGRSDLAAVHILSHGQAGGFQLGATWIDQQTLMGVSEEVARWASTFASDGDLLIYGCNLAATAEGQELIDGLSALTGADVAGSTDLTGSAALGGNWDLEYVHGAVTETIGQDAALGITWNDVLLAAPTAPESRVNTTTANAQETAFASPQAVAVDAAGNYVVTWADSNLDGSGYGVYFQRYSAAGVTQGAETRANTTTLNAQQFPTVDMDLAGNFVIAWSGNGTGDTAGIFAQRFNATGVAQGAEFRVNTTTTNTQQQPSVALDSLGNFVIVWSGEGTGDTAGVFGQRYTAAGAAIGGEFRINSTTTGTQSFASVDRNPKGDFVVVWSGEGTGDLSGVFGQRYDTTGTAVGGEFRVNTTTTNTQQYGRVAMNSAGGFVVTWSGEGTGDTTGVFARRYDSAGTALDATEFRVNTTVTNTQQYSTVASDSSGNFLVTWTDSASDGNQNGVYAQRYNAAGVVQDVEFRVAGTTANNQQFSSAIIAPNTDFTIVWSGNGTGDTAGVFQRRFDTRMTAIYAASNAAPFNISTINITTGAATTVGTSSYSTAANARDPVSGDVFYVEFTNPTARLSRYNPLTGTNTLITTLASLPGNIIKLSFRSDGTLWAATGSPSDTLYQLNPTTGAVISSGVVSTLAAGSGDMAFDTNNVLWWNSGNSLYTVNVSTYVATLIGVITPTITINGFAFGSNGTLYAHAGNNIYTINQTTAVATLVGATGTTGIADLGSSAVNVNDAPINSVPATQSTNEDIARVFSVGNGNLISITDVDAGTASLQITLTGTNGAISLSGTSGLTFTVGDGTSDATMTFTGTLANINTALAGLSFLSTANYFGPASLKITTNDQGNTGAGGAMSDSDTIGINVASVSDAPTTSNNAVTTSEETPVTFSAANFPFSDGDVGDTMQSVKITALPSVGTLTLGGVAVTLNQVIPVASLGTLVFTPALNGNGSPYTTFSFQVSDGTLFSTSATMTVNVTPVNDPPTTSNNSVTTPEDTPITFAAASFPFSDVDTSDTLQSVKITSLPSVGTLTLGGVAVTLNQIIPTASLNTLVFTPALNANGSPYTTFTFQVSDGTVFSSSATMTVNVTPVNDPPTTSNNSVTTPEDTPVTFAAASFPFSDVDTSDSLQSVKITALPSVGTLTLGGVAVTLNQIIPTASLNTLVFTPALNGTGSPYTTFTFQVSDGTVFSSSATMTVNVTPVNDPPTTSNNSATTPEDTPVTFTAASFPFSDVDSSDTLQNVKITALPSVGTLTLGAVAVTLNQIIPTASLITLVFTPALNANGSPYTTFTFQVSDGTVFSGSATMTVNVTPVNDPPVADDEAFTVAEDGAVIINVLAGDTDLDGDTLTVTEIDGTPISLGSPVAISTGVVSLNADGTLTFAPNTNFNGPAAFDYTVSDGNGGSDIGNVSGNVTPVNDPPVADDEIFTVAEDGSVIIPVLVGDTDLDGDTLTITEIDGSPISVGSPVTIATGVVSLNADGTLTFTPNANFNGPASFDYTVSDGNGGSDVGNVSGTVTPVNDPPVADDETFTVAEDGSVIIPVLVGDTDLDGDTLTVTEIDGMPISLGSPVTIATGVVSLNADGTLTFTPNANFNDPASFDYTVSDGNGGTDVGNVSGNVTPVNDPPVADDEMFVVAEDGSVIIDVITGDTDLDGDALTVTEIDGSPISVGSPVTIATGLVSLNADGTLTFTPNANFNGPATFDYTLSDGNGGSDLGNVSGNVTPVNDPPVADDETFTVAEDGAVIIDVLTGDNDLDGDTLTVTQIDGTPINLGSPVTIATGLVSLNADGTLTFTPNTNFNGSAAFDYTLSDGNGGSDLGNVSGNVTPVNDPPVADDESFTVAEDGAVIIDVLTGDTDLDGDALTVTEIDGTPISVGSPVTIATGLVSLNADGTLTFTPNANFNGPASFDYTLSDGNGGSHIGNVSGNVTPVNDPPVADDETFSVAEDGAVIIDVLTGDTDLDGDTLTVTEIDGTPISLGSPVTIATGVVSLNADGTQTFTPNANFNGPASFDYTVSDGNGGTDTGNVSGNVTPVNDPPVADDETFTVAEDGAVIIDVLTGDTDLDGDTLTVTQIDGTPINLGSPVTIATGLVSLNADGTLTFTPNTNFNGSAAFDYTLSDGNGGSDLGNVSGNVTPVNDPPVADDETFTVAEDGSVIISVLTGDTDLDGDALTVTEIDGTPISLGSPVTIATGVVSLNADGTLTFAPNANFNGPAAFDYTVSDGNGGTDVGNVSGNVTPVNDPPVADDETFTVAEDGFVIIPVLTGDTDLDGDSLTVTEIDGTPISLGSPVTIATGVVSLNADGTLTFTPNANFNGPASFDYTVSDGNGGSDIGNVSGNVAPVNDPPVADDESFTVAEDGAVIIDVLTGDTDLDGDSLTVTEIDGTPISLGSPVTIATGVVSLNADGTLTFTPNANFNGPATFDYTLSDGNGGSDIGNVSGNVTPVNDPPVADDEIFTVAEDGSVIIDVLTGDTDLDGDTLTVTEIDGTPISLGGPVTIATGVVSLNADGTLTFTPNPNFNGPAAFDYTLSDGNGGSDIGNVSGTVTPVNDPAVADDENFTVAEDGSVIIPVLVGDTDLDGDTLTVTEIDGSPISVGSPVTIATGVVSLNADGTLTFTPNTNFNGPATFDYTVSDGNGGTDIGNVSGNVTPVNDPPVARNNVYATAENISLMGNVLTDNTGAGVDSDLDGDSLTVTVTPVVDVINGLLVLAVDGSFTYTPNAGFNGFDSFTYEIRDAGGMT